MTPHRGVINPMRACNTGIPEFLPADNVIEHHAVVLACTFGWLSRLGHATTCIAMQHQCIEVEM
jgi:hypothetical protein